MKSYGVWEAAVASVAVGHAGSATRSGATIHFSADDSVYVVRIEDRTGRCWQIAERVSLRAGSDVARTRSSQRGCPAVFMAHVVRRGRRLATIPLAAGKLDDYWSVASAARGFADVYADSVVVRLTTLEMRSLPSIPKPGRVDSIALGIGIGDSSWSIARVSRALKVGAIVPIGETWTRRNLRFTIPVDSTFRLASGWPIVEVYVQAPKSADNPLGLAWTYGHAPRGFFAGVVWPPILR